MKKNIFAVLFFLLPIASSFPMDTDRARVKSEDPTQTCKERFGHRRKIFIDPEDITVSRDGFIIRMKGLFYHVRAIHFGRGGYFIIQRDLDDRKETFKKLREESDGGPVPHKRKHRRRHH
jgi:hypothetical protein